MEVQQEAKEVVAPSEKLQEKTMSSDDGEYFDYEDEGFDDPLDGESLFRILNARVVVPNHQGNSKDLDHLKARR